ncbi:hypothetical protein C8Q74DRAFT_1186124, partial [Fomes fomentarius]
EKEIPLPMLALIDTVIHALINEWTSGTHKAITFAADTYLDVYNEHITIKEANIRAYHLLMHRLYKDA